MKNIFSPIKYLRFKYNRYCNASMISNLTKVLKIIIILLILIFLKMSNDVNLSEIKNTVVLYTIDNRVNELLLRYTVMLKLTI